jgi:hypothetical protein
MQKRGFRRGIDKISRFFDVSDHDGTSDDDRAAFLAAAPYAQPWLTADFCTLWLRPSLRWAIETVPALFERLADLAAKPDVHAVCPGFWARHIF